MKRMLLLLTVCAALPIARADHREEERRNEERRDRRDQGPHVMVFQHAGYEGSFLVLYPGDALDNLGNVRFPDGSRTNDSISSIRVEGGAEIYVYTDSRFRGNVMRLTDNVRDLTTRLLPASGHASWNDRISSIRVAERRRTPGGKRMDPDEIVRNVYRDLLGREPDASGSGNYRQLVIDQGWTEEMVRDNVRHSDEFRQEGAVRIIRQAYRDALNREPRFDEQERYRKILLEKDWIGSDVRDDLKRGEETRKNPPRRER